MIVMRQLMSRVDDDLHERLKARAAAEGRSVNAFIVDLLTAALGESTPRARLRERAKARGLLAGRPRPVRQPSRDEASAAGRALGTAVSEALQAEREAGRG